MDYKALRNISGIVYGGMVCINIYMGYYIKEENDVGWGLRVLI